MPNAVVEVDVLEFNRLKKNSDKYIELINKFDCLLKIQSVDRLSDITVIEADATKLVSTVYESIMGL